MTSLALAAGLLAYTVASSAFVGFYLGPKVREAGARRRARLASPSITQKD